MKFRDLVESKLEVLMENKSKTLKDYPHLHKMATHADLADHEDSGLSYEATHKQAGERKVVDPKGWHKANEWLGKHVKDHKKFIEHYIEHGEFPKGTPGHIEHAMQTTHADSQDH